MFKAAKLSQDLSVAKSYFERSIWILNVMHTASYNRKKAAIFMFMQVCFLLHGHICFVTNGRNSHFCRLTHSSSFRGWTHPSLANLEGQLHAQDRLEGGWKSVLVHQRRANCVSLGALLVIPTVWCIYTLLLDLFAPVGTTTSSKFHSIGARQKVI